MSAIATLFATIGADTSGLEDALKKTDSSLNSTAGNMKALATGAVAMLMAALIALGASAINSALQFDRSMANISAVTGKTGGDLKLLSDQILEMGSKSTAGPQAVADAYYDIASGVADASTHMSILQAAIATSEAGQADLTATTSGLISVMNAYKFSADEAGFASDVFTRTVGLGVGSMNQFVAAMSPLSGLANNVGIKFNDLGAMMAYMTTQGVSAAQSATQLKAAMTAMLKPNADMAKGLRLIGERSGSAAIAKYGLVGALEKLKAAAGGSTDKLAKMLGSVEALQAAVVLTGGDFEQFASTFESGLNGATDAARQLQLASVSAQWDIFKSQLEGIAISIGSLLLPPLNTLLMAVNDGAGIVGRFREAWDNDFGGIRTAVEATAAAVKPVVDGMVDIAKKALDAIFPKQRDTKNPEAFADNLMIPSTKDTNMSGRIAAAFQFDPKLIEDLNNLGKAGDLVAVAVVAIGVALAGVAWGGVTTAVGALAAAFWALLSPILLILAPLVLAGALIAAYVTNFGGFADRVNELGDAIRGTVTGAINDVMGKIKELQDAWEKFTEQFKDEGNSGGGNGAGGSTGDGGSRLFGSSYGGPKGQSFQNFDMGMSEGANQRGGQGVLDGMFQKPDIKGVLQSAIDEATTFITGGGAAPLTQAIATLLTSALESLKGSAQQIPTTIAQAISTAIDWVRGPGTQAGSQVFSAFASTVASTLAGVGGPLVGTVVAALYRIAGIFMALPNAVGAQVGKQIQQAVGARAVGGDVIGGMPYLVGERGPELMVPGKSGTVIPSNVLGRMGGGDGGGGTTIMVNGPITVTGVQNPEQFFDEMARVAKRRNLSVAQSMGA